MATPSATVNPYTRPARPAPFQVTHGPDPKPPPMQLRRRTYSLVLYSGDTLSEFEHTLKPSIVHFSPIRTQQTFIKEGGFSLFWVRTTSAQIDVMLRM